jgi:hypothetical protein
VPTPLTATVLSPIRGLGLTPATATGRARTTSAPSTSAPSTTTRPPAGLKPAAPPPRRKIITRAPDGSEYQLPEPPPPPPPPAPFRLDDLIDSGLSDQDLNQQLTAIETESRFLSDMLHTLGEPEDDECHTIFEKRQRYESRLYRLSERYRLLREEKSRRFDKHVDEVARQSAAGLR